MLQNMSRGDKIAAGGGLALVISLFLPWFALNLGDTGLNEILGDQLSDALSVTAFEFMDFMDIVLLIIGVGTIALVVLAALGKIDTSLRRYIEGAGGLAVVAVILTLVRNGFDTGVDMRLGLFLGLIASIAIAVGGYFNRTDGTV